MVYPPHIRRGNREQLNLTEYSDMRGGRGAVGIAYMKAGSDSNVQVALANGVDRKMGPPPLLSKWRGAPV